MERLTPCAAGDCPAVYRSDDGDYLVVGRLVHADVGVGEAAVVVPAEVMAAAAAAIVGECG